MGCCRLCVSCRHCLVTAACQHFQQVLLLQTGFLAIREVLLGSPCPWMGHYIFGVLFSFSRAVLPWLLTVVSVHSPPLKALGFSLKHPVQG